MKRVFICLAVLAPLAALMVYDETWVDVLAYFALGKVAGDIAVKFMEEKS